MVYKYEYKGFEVAAQVAESPTTWQVRVDVQKFDNDVVVKAFPPFEESFARSNGVLSAVLHMKKIVEQTIDDYISSGG
ncbi:hypothetical protein GW590_19975 [Rahnella sp. SAP-1]|jgi:hypothetical protein|uniref:Uncharacterized protein n=1 Tax=Rouxiella aceris TaxID=2703884 RepID=A0A848MP70_9GAMM|nr:hypothetical protein [Rouxiella aceris]NMP29133.1 hypothetical protein [Rouxiella aceris]